MKHTILAAVAAIILSGTEAFAQQHVKLNLQQATVFLSGAVLENTVKVALEKGENEVSFSNVATNVNEQSIVINSTNGVAVASSTFRNGCPVTDDYHRQLAKMDDSIARLQEKKIPINVTIAVLNDRIELLETDMESDGDNAEAPTTKEVAKRIRLISKKKEKYLTEKLEQNYKIRAIDDQVAAISARRSDYSQKGVIKGGQILVKFYAREATTSTVTIKYLVPTAGWSPAYDIWADDVSSPIKLHYKANIYQSTGIDWEKVHLTLSTGNPQEGMQAPISSAWYLSLSAPPPPPPPVKKDIVVTQTTTLKEAKVLAYKRPLVDKYVNNTVLTADEIKTAPTSSSDDLVALAPGVYQSARGAAASYEGARQTTSITNYVAVDNSGVNTIFDIEFPYTIPSDGQKHIVSVKEYQVPATYQYYAMPSLDRDAFLQAQITDWNDLNLLPGPTSIFYEGTYIGQGRIDARTLTDTMYLSLGRDKKIVIRREQDKKMHTLKKTAANEEETFGYTISVRNTRKAPINILLVDQLPVSNESELKVEPVNPDSGEYNTASGALQWVLNVDGSETRKVSFGYTIKHPKERQLIGMR